MVQQGFIVCVMTISANFYASLVMKRMFLTEALQYHIFWSKWKDEIVRLF